METSDTEFPIIETERLLLVKPTDAHAPALFRMLTNSDVTKYYHVLPFAQESDVLPVIQNFSKQFADQKAIRWVLLNKQSGILIGTAGFQAYTIGSRGTLVYALAPEHWGYGYATEAIKAIVDHGFGRLGFRTIEAEVLPGNKNSERVLEKSGFTYMGLLGGWSTWQGKSYDINMFSLTNPKLTQETKTTDL